jgi:hypothetical protein
VNASDQLGAAFLFVAGISLSTTQWQKLKSLISEVDDAVKEKC